MEAQAAVACYQLVIDASDNGNNGVEQVKKKMAPEVYFSMEPFPTRLSKNDYPTERRN
jgi:hypothetical protein